MVPVLNVKCLTVKYGNKMAVDTVSFTVNGGEVLGVLGTNGAGKSTMFRAILGLLPHMGQVSLFGAVTGDRKYLLPFVGYVPQMMDFEPRFPATVRDVVRMGVMPERRKKRGLAMLNKAGVPLGNIEETRSERRMVSDALDIMGMGDMEDRRIGSLSGGQMQRIFVAQSLAKDPLLLILDEPSSSMDIESQSLFFAAIRRAVRERDITVMMSIHDLNVLQENSTMMMFLNNSIIYHGETGNFFADPDRIKLYTEASMHAGGHTYPV